MDTCMRVLLTLALLLSTANGFPANSAAAPAPTPLGLTPDDMKDAFPSRDLLNASNWYGTSLYGWDKCKEKDPAWKEKIIEAYTDSNKLVNFDGVRKDLDFNSAPALEYLGPSGLNVDQQKQIQAVFANVATVKEGTSWWTPNWIRIRCDDPLGICPAPPEDPCPPPPQSDPDEQPAVMLAYARNAAQTTDGYPDISFCPGFFQLRNLDNAMAYGSGPRSPILKYDLSRYEGRADVFLHELMHLDLAADSVNNNPNPQIHDLKIKFTYGTGRNRGTKSKWTQVYGPKLAKILARFQPFGAGTKQTGYFIQRSDDSLTMFALARYVQKLYGCYPHIPVIYDQISEAPMIPLDRDKDTYSVLFVSDNNNPVTLVNFTVRDNGTRIMSNSGDCRTVLDQSSDSKIVGIGAPNAADQYPQSYWDNRNKWLQEIKDYAESGNLKQCKLSIVEVWTCEDASKNLYAQLSITGADGKSIYTTPQSTSSPGQRINAGQSLSIQETGMSNPLMVTGEHTNDYIQFSYGTASWVSGTTDGDNNCTLKGSDWSKEGPKCPGMAQARQFDCVYQC